MSEHFTGHRNPERHLVRRLLAWWRGYDAMCPACGFTYRSRPGHREHDCNAY